MKVHKWQPKNFISAAESSESFACIILNRPINFEPLIFQSLWNHAKCRVVVDGGANHWFDYVSKHNLQDKIEQPNFYTGDMDSITKESIEGLTQMNCQRILTPDQDETDCTKSVFEMKSTLIADNIRNVLLFTDYGGRIDHTLSQINTLYKTLLKELRVYLISHDTLAWLLCSGHHEIEIPQKLVNDEIWCSYVPMSGTTCVTTTGLKWDLSEFVAFADGIVEFGGIISTSNTYKNTIVSIQCDKCLFWSMGTQKG